MVDNLIAPLSVEFDKDDNMYVADRDGFCIVRRSAADGAITKTTVGSKGHGPMHIGFDSKGNMYVTRQSSYCIDMVAADGTVTTIAGTGASSKESSDGEAGNPLTGQYRSCVRLLDRCRRVPVFRRQQFPYHTAHRAR